jgi:hypothetical protein
MRKPGHPPVATHAADLYAPGAEDQIRDKLAAGGYLPHDAGRERSSFARPSASPGSPRVSARVGWLREVRNPSEGSEEDSDAALADGLRKFQSAHDLPATGVADDETVHRLGLDPGKVFRR